MLLGRGQPVVPEQIEGPVFIGSNELSGFDWGPYDLNPYQQFYDTHPTTILGGEILEFDGSFTVTKIAALSHFAIANRLMGQKQFGAALEELKTAERLDPDFISTHSALASLYAGMKEPENALSEYQTAMHIYQTVHPDYQAWNSPPVNPRGSTLERAGSNRVIAANNKQGAPVSAPCLFGDAAI